LPQGPSRVVTDPGRHGPTAAISAVMRAISARWAGVGSTAPMLSVIHPPGSSICHSINTVETSSPGPSPEAAAVIATWRTPCSARAAAFAREVVTRSAPEGAARARTLLWSCARLATWGEQKGLEPCATALLHPSVLERYVLSGLADLSEGTRRTMRANLRYVARHAAPQFAAPRAAVLRRDTLKRPYTDAQVERYLALVMHQSTPERVARLTGLLCLGLGAGLEASDMRLVRGNDIVERSGGLVVCVGGAKARLVPVLERFGRRLRASATFAGGGFVVGGNVPGRKNITSALVATMDVGRLDRLEIPRLRATWLAEHIRRLGLDALVAAAGLTSSSRVVELAVSMGPPDEAQVMTVLQGT
jgi:integrase